MAADLWHCVADRAGADVSDLELDEHRQVVAELVPRLAADGSDLRGHDCRLGDQDVVQPLSRSDGRVGIVATRIDEAETAELADHLHFILGIEVAHDDRGPATADSRCNTAGLKTSSVFFFAFMMLGRVT